LGALLKVAKQVAQVESAASGSFKSFTLNTKPDLSAVNVCGMAAKLWQVNRVVKT
jgi:hypothetical protein